MSTFGPTIGLSGPAPTPPRYSLLSVATIVPPGVTGLPGNQEPDIHYLAGAEVWPYPDAGSGNIFNPCATGTTREKTGVQDLPLPEFASFVVYETIECTSRSIGEDYDLWAGRARLALEATESFQVEREFSKGVQLPTNPHLTDAGVNVVDGSGLAPALALQELVQSASQKGTEFTVHVDPATAVAFSADLLIEKEGGGLRVVGTGSPVVVGTGYVGATPTGGLSDGTSWIFATGPIEVRRSEIEIVPGSVKEAMDRQQNDITVRAERYYLVDWDTVLQDAVLVNRAA